MNKYIRFHEKLLEILAVFDFGIKWIGALKVVLYTVTLGCFYTTGIVDLMNVMNDFNLFAENFAMLLIGLTGFVKFATLIYSRKKIMNLREIVNCDGIIGKEFKNHDRSIIDHYDRIGLKFSKTYGWIIFIVCNGFLLHTLPGYLFGHGSHLPFRAVYPFSLNSTTRFIFAYVHQFISCYFYLLIYVAFDSWFIFLIHHACGRLFLLQNLLEKIADENQQHMTTQERIKECVRIHQNVYKFSQYIEDTFNTCNLIHFLISSIAICISGYEVVSTRFKEPQLLVKHLFSIYGQVVQLLIFNWCGQLMENESFGISQAISRSNFYKLDIDHQRDLGLILLRAQRPMYLTAGRFSNLSLLNFTTLIKRSMSYFTVLTSIQEY